MVNQRKVWLALFGLHFQLGICICCWETVWLTGHSSTILPLFVKNHCLSVDALATASLAKAARGAGFVRKALNAYLHLAGIQSGYGFFAPNVPDGYKLLFAFSYPDGHEDVFSAEADQLETNVRLARLTDYIGRTRSDIVREDMIKLLAYAAWQRRRDATGIRASLLTLNQPSAEEFLGGQRSTYRKTYEYEFGPLRPRPRSGDSPN